MWTQHFQLTSQPFAEYMPAERLWPDERMNQGLARLDYLLADGTFGVITGATGLGKSALVKRFLSRRQEPGTETFYLHLTHLSASDLLKLLASTLGEVPQWGKDRLLDQLVQRAGQHDGPLVVVLDEAHLLEPAALTDLRLLVSSALEETPRWKLVLVGQERLLTTLRRSSLRDLWDRISVRFHLHPLSKSQTAAYIDFQMQTAGGSERVFESEVKELIHDYSGGVPRQINNLATASLLAAATQKASRINEGLFQQTLTEFHLP